MAHPCCCSDTCTPVCGPQCATTGSVGSESGSECTDCGSVIITDNFSSALTSPPWQTPTTGCIGNGIGAFGAHVTSGKLDMGSGAAIIQPFDRPALSGFCVRVKATISTQSTGDTYGITLAYGRYLFARPAFGTYAVQSCIDSDGCIGVGSTFSVISVTPANGDVIEFIIRDEGGADGICSVCYKINGTTVRVEEGAQFCFDCTMYAGFLTSGLSVSPKFDDFEVATS